jgi:translation elongation factor EF-1alpha
VEGKAMGEQEIGRITHYFTHLGVAAIVITGGELKVGDTIHVKGHTSDFTTTVLSMQIEHKEVQAAKVGESIGIKVPEHAREHDQVFLVTAD